LNKKYDLNNRNRLILITANYLIAIFAEKTFLWRKEFENISSAERVNTINRSDRFDRNWVCAYFRGCAGSLNHFIQRNTRIEQTIRLSLSPWRASSSEGESELYHPVQAKSSKEKISTSSSIKFATLVMTFRDSVL
jgi:hypothetical protein